MHYAFAPDTYEAIWLLSTYQTRWAYHTYIAWKPSSVFDSDCPLTYTKSQASDFQAVLVPKLPVAGMYTYVPAT
jgi:hypothetical protein